MNLPNILTLMRVVLIPFCIFFYLLPYSWGPIVAAVVFTIAAVTDWFDGYLARKWNQMSPFGAFLDPVADKLIVASALIVLVAVHSSLWLTIPAVVIIGREIVISALREWMAEIGKRANVKVSMIGKVKTTFQMIAIGVLLSQSTLTNNWIVEVGYGILVFAAVLTLWSMIMYLKAAWPLLKS